MLCKKCQHDASGRNNWEVARLSIKHMPNQAKKIRSLLVLWKEWMTGIFITLRIIYDNQIKTAWVETDIMNKEKISFIIASYTAEPRGAVRRQITCAMWPSHAAALCVELLELFNLSAAALQSWDAAYISHWPKTSPKYYLCSELCYKPFYMMHKHILSNYGGLNHKCTFRWFYLKTYNKNSGFLNKGFTLFLCSV